MDAASMIMGGAIASIGWIGIWAVSEIVRAQRKSAETQEVDPGSS